MPELPATIANRCRVCHFLRKWRKYLEEEACDGPDYLAELWQCFDAQTEHRCPA